MQHSPPAVQSYLFSPAAPPADPDSVTRSSGWGVAIWLIAAASLVIGILIGFGSGYTAGRRAEALLAVPPVAAATERPSASGNGQNTFTEGTVSEPVRVDPEPIVTAPEPPPESQPPPAPEPPAAAPGPAERPAPIASATSGRGSLQILSRPSGAEVTLDGAIIGRTPLVISNVRVGRHDVRLGLSGFRPWATSVQVTGGARTRVAASLEQ